MRKLGSKWGKTPIARCISILSKVDQRKLFMVGLLQIAMSVLDLLGVAAIGLLGALSVTGLQSREPGNTTVQVLKLLQIADQPFQMQAMILSVGALVLLTGRTLLSIFFSRRILFFLSRRGALISANLVSKLLSQPLLVIQSKTTQETLYSLTRGVELIVLQVIATAIVMVSDLSLLIILGLALFLVSPPSAISTFLVFFLIAIMLNRFSHRRANTFGRKSSELNIRSNEKIVEVFGSYRESVVRNRREYYAREIGSLRNSLADASAELAFLPYVSKYVIETAIIFGGVLVGASQLFFKDAAGAVATLGIFLAAGARIAPAVLRVQQGSIQIQGSIGQAKPTLELIDSLLNVPIGINLDDTVKTDHVGFFPEVKIENVSMSYPNRNIRAISEFSLNIPVGSSVAIVGPSGAGKTTIIDILLGVLNPNQGSVEISGLPPLKAFEQWPGAVSYVPQDVAIVAGSIRENIALGYPSVAATDELVMSALKVAHLDGFVAELPNGLDTQVGERGAKISGGQRQRLGIARAMFTRPCLLVLDEATSSLDAETEANIADAIHSLRGSTTVVMIAHRLSTVRRADVVVYLTEGKILSKGSFDEVRRAVPDFDRQAKLMGL
jgi:ABC-type multidrug transport system fused ATPase/permease subunit